MFKNIDNFIKWLENVSKNEATQIYIQETLKEIDNQYNNTGLTEYELSKFETKSGKPETYRYNVEHEEEEDGNEKTIYIL